MKAPGVLNIQCRHGIERPAGRRALIERVRLSPIAIGVEQQQAVRMLDLNDR